jgi:hypothetical protein
MSQNYTIKLYNNNPQNANYSGKWRAIQNLGKNNLATDRHGLARMQD